MRGKGLSQSDHFTVDLLCTKMTSKLKYYNTDCGKISMHVRDLSFTSKYLLTTCKI